LIHQPGETSHRLQIEFKIVRNKLFGLGNVPRVKSRFKSLHGISAHILIDSFALRFINIEIMYIKIGESFELFKRVLWRIRFYNYSDGINFDVSRGIFFNDSITSSY